MVLPLNNAKRKKHRRQHSFISVLWYFYGFKDSTVTGKLSNALVFLLAFIQYWRDHRLQWNSSEYDDIHTIVTPASFLWLPDITLYKQVSSKFQKEVDDILKLNKIHCAILTSNLFNYALYITFALSSEVQMLSF